MNRPTWWQKNSEKIESIIVKFCDYWKWIFIDFIHGKIRCFHCHLIRETSITVNMIFRVIFGLLNQVSKSPINH